MTNARLVATLALAALAGCASTPLPAPSVALAAAAVAAAAPSTVVAATVPAAADDAALQQRFDAWVADVRERARAAGIAESTLRAAFADVHFVPRLLEQDRAQPELTRTAWDYLDNAVSTRRVAQGQERLAQSRAEAGAAAARGGVPAAVLVAIWGMESDYGANAGDTPTIDALATLGFEGRREDWARGELLAALKIVQQGDVAPARMIGSWAGAMGQPQFLPSAFLRDAVDADGDGRRDIWGSTADVLASIANFLAHAGWRAGEPWGVEVALPAGFDPGRADTTLRQDSAQWAAEGVRSIDGDALPAIADATILLPAGARGPAFLVGSGFRAILRYNNSTSYALAVGVLARRLDGSPGVQAAWPRDLQALTRTQVQALQAALSQRGFDSGAPDGRLGPATREALRRWQRSVGLPADGFPTLELLQRLQAP